MYVNRKIVMGKPMFIAIMALIFILILVAINSKVAANQFIETYTDKIPAMEQKIADLEKQNAELLKNVDDLKKANAAYEKSVAELKLQMDESIMISANTTKPVSTEKEVTVSEEDTNPILIASNKDVETKNDPAKEEQETTTNAEEEMAITSDEESVSTAYNFTDITQKSNLTADQFNQLISNTMDKYGKTNSGLLNTGEYLEYIEDTYNINGLFALSVSSLESGWGLKHPNNNLFGFNSGAMYFDDDGESINYFGKLIRERYIDLGLTSIGSISSKYCPPNSDKWTKDIHWFMGVYGEAVNNILIE